MATKNNLNLLNLLIRKRHLEEYPNLQEDDFFEIFAAEQILKYKGLSPDELEDGRCGGPYDGGFDGIHLFINGDRVDNSEESKHLSIDENVKIDLHLIQAKNKDKIEQSVINTFSATAEDIIDESKLEDTANNYNSTVIDVFRNFHQLYQAHAPSDPEINITFYYVSKGNPANDRMKGRANNLCKKIRNQYVFGCKCEFQFVGARRLLDLTRRSHSSLELQFADPPLCSDDEANSFVGLVHLDRFYDFITTPDGKLRSYLFDANVRDWQGNNRVNRRIQDSLRNSYPPDFWWLNNGITITASNTSPKYKKLHLGDPSIVNGLQTSHAIYDHFSRQNPLSPDKRKLLVRVIVEKDTERREQIIEATNNQTLVTMEALRSLDKIHRDIELYLGEQNPPIYYDRRKNFYRNQNKPRNQIIGIKRLAKSVLAVALFEPDEARGRPGDYLRGSDDKQYKKYLKVFNEEYKIELYDFCARFDMLIDELIARKQFDNSSDMTDRKSVKYFIMTHIILRHTKISSNNSGQAWHTVQDIKVEHLDNSLMTDGVQRVMQIYYLKRNQTVIRFNWKDFQRVFFEDLDNLILST